MYDYKCTKCGNIHEVLGNTNPDELYCQLCWIRTDKKESLSKMISSPAGIHFKGSGFYETDYKNKG
jgi:putative FmdB family regulatory protein